jgi:NAD(P)-dependent dehydrogenase (short-subunit alcohol dehydrogenase family)
MNDNGCTGKLDGRVALVTGGAQGIGREIASVFQREGACVLILDNDSEQGNKTATELTAKNSALPVTYIQANLGEPRDIDRAVDAMGQVHGRLDVLVNNAGIELDKPIEKIRPEDWDLILNVNLRGPFLLARAAVPLFPQTGGTIVNISSIHASHAFPNSIPYACSKAGMIALTRNLALDLSPRRIRVNCICPGYIDTRLWEHYLSTAPDPAVVAARTAALHPVGRRGLPRDVGEAALFFASDASGFITGTDLVVDGGLTVRAHP